MVSVSQTNGDMVNLWATHRAHFGFQPEKKLSGSSEDFVSEFAHALKDAFYRVNDQQHESERLTTALAVRPDTVDIHDVTIAAEKARISLLFTKSIVERVIQGYRELINVR
jgi:flagellar hook-basal body complex protein FliE